jgi:predicted PurR-regulated permease PerM
MADEARTPRAPLNALTVRLSLRSALAIVIALALTVLVLEIARDAERVIAWVLTSVAVAAMVSPLIEWMSRRIPRGLAVLLVLAISLATIGFVAYRIVDDIATQTDRLEEAAPERAAELERSSEFFRELELRRRVERLVDGIPARLAGGEPAEVVRSAASRGVAFLANIILTIFFVLYGPHLVDAGFEQIGDPNRRRRVEQVTRNATRRTLTYARVRLLEVAVWGFVAFAIARLANVPGPAALAVWVALWTLVPVAGVVIGALPIVAFAGAQSPTRAIVVGVAFALIGAADWLLNRQLQRTTVAVGSFVILLAGFCGLELYGLLGALLFVLGAVLAVAIVSEIGPEEVAEVVVAPLAGVADDDDASPEQ